MRLVAWNANCALRTSRTFSQVLEFIEPLLADVLVLSEGPANSGAAAWTWRGPAAAKLSVWTRPGYSVSPVASDLAIPQSALLQVRGPVDFNLVALWPVEQGRLTYAGILRRALDAYLPHDASARRIVAGDLNSSTRVVAQRASHPKLVSALTARGLTSVYHHQEGVAHGDERTGTYRSGKREFCLDYAFVPLDLLDVATLAVPRGRQWTLRSDHLPLILDVQDAAFRHAAP